MSTSNISRMTPEPASQRHAKTLQNRNSGTHANAAGSKMLEAEMVRLAQQGDCAAFATLYDLHKRGVYALCRRMSGSEEDAEDLTQEVFLLVFRKIGAFRGQSAFSTWLHRVTVNVALMRFRKKGFLAVSLQALLDPEERETLKGDLGRRDDVLAGAIDRVNLERALEHLPARCREVFVRFDIEGYEHNEIAAMNGCTIGISKSQLYKARMKLRSILKITKTGREQIRNRRAGAYDSAEAQSLQLPSVA
ncbi:MAG: sigma-70 family RNA polymerase sigma factor [Candidatus Korobacteraceae bacterium]